MQRTVRGPVTGQYERECMCLQGLAKTSEPSGKGHWATGEQPHSCLSKLSCKIIKGEEPKYRLLAVLQANCIYYNLIMLTIECPYNFNNTVGYPLHVKHYRNISSGPNNRKGRSFSFLSILQMSKVRLVEIE